MNRNGTKATLRILLCSLLLFLLGAGLSMSFFALPGRMVLERCTHLDDWLPGLFRFPWQLSQRDCLVGLLLSLSCLLLTSEKRQGRNRLRPSVEYGSARWGNASDIAPFIHPDFFQNLLLTETERLSRSARAKDPKNNRNKNVVVFGGSGSGKTRSFLEPNLMQCTCDYVVCDPKGEILRNCGSLLEKRGYEIRVLDTVDFARSMHYNPFAYLRKEEDVLSLVTALMANTKGDGKDGEDFWQKSEALLYMALIGLLHSFGRKDEQNFQGLLDMINRMEIRENSPTFLNDVDRKFLEIEARYPNHFAVRMYKKYKLATGKTAKSILISAGARLAPLDVSAVRRITSFDELHLEQLGDIDPDHPDRKHAIFLIMSDHDPTFSFLISMVYTQMFQILCEKADASPGGHLQRHVQCLMDEVANIGQIPHLERLLATIRSRNISACLILQTKSQLKALYGDHADTILGNCDTTIFLGGKELSTLQEISQQLGKETIQLETKNETKGGTTSTSQHHGKMARDLMSVDELATMDGDHCICLLRGIRPFYSRKFDLRSHPHYPYLQEADPGNSYRRRKTAGGKQQKYRVFYWENPA